MTILTTAYFDEWVSTFLSWSGKNWQWILFGILWLTFLLIIFEFARNNYNIEEEK